MGLDILAFSLAAGLLTAIIAMLMIGLADVADPPISTRCPRCSRWTMDTHHRLRPMCLHCRLITAVGTAVQRRH